jgi:hypothetical protein
MSTATAPDLLLYPLSLFRQRYEIALPAFETIPGEAVPEPYRKLLVHTGDMTSRLEAFHGGEIVLTVLHRDQTATCYEREVVLNIEETGLPVEYGAIEIVLDAFEPALQEKILEAHLPLGGLLNSHHVRYSSRPKAFIKIKGDETMESIFKVGAGQVFYGRCNELLGADGQVLARIVEVLRP